MPRYAASASSISSARSKSSPRCAACCGRRAFIVSYSNRCFPTKAVAIWRSLDQRGHASLIHRYMDSAGFAGIEAKVLANGMHGDPLVAVVGAA